MILKQLRKLLPNPTILKAWTLPYNQVKERFANVQSLLPEAEESGDQAFVEELLSELDGIEKIIFRTRNQKNAFR